ncbi:MAG: zinc-dependent alcohol dehydrogenase family protein [Deltaproteobacteria bacterium]|nr:zinc-dependent alcohol dehydrogenase family protein [Deltaproteobacteria bacterium]
MRAMVLEKAGQPLVLRELAEPTCRREQLVVRVQACGVCRTDLHVLDGELDQPKLPLVLGHQIVGEVVRLGSDVRHLSLGQRVGIPWLGWTDGTCAQCRAGRENLCERARFTGYTLDGGFADFAAADARFAFPLPSEPPATELAPLLCAGLIGYRAYRLAGDATKLGLYGFGAAAHILAQVAVHEGRQVFAFTRPGDEKGQAFARELGCAWAGGSDAKPPEALDAAIIFASVGALVPAALRAVGPGGSVVCAGIHMSDIPSFPYADLWEERVIRSVANLTRDDGKRFLELAPRVPVKTQVTVFPLEQANEALQALRAGAFEGAAALQIG